MNLKHERIECQAETARTQQIAQNAISNLYLSGRASDLPDEELDALTFILQVEQHERDERRGKWAIPDCPF